MADGSVIIDSKLDSTGFKKGLDSLGNIAKKGLGAVTKSIDVVKDAFVAMTATMVAVGGYSIKVGSDFEKSMSQVAATMGMAADEVKNGSKQFKILEDAAKKAGATTQFSATESAEALNYLALAGYNAAEAAEALPKVLNLAAAGGLELGYASDVVTDSMAALGLEMSQMTSFTDKMAKTAQKSNTSVAQLGEAILTVGGTAKVLSGGVTEMNTALGVLADNGIKGSEGGTALRNVILSLTAPTDKAREALDSLGVSALDSEGNVRPLNETFKDLDEALGTMADGEKTQVLNEIFNKVDLKSVNALLANSGERFDELSGYIENADGAAASMAATLNDNLSGKITILKSSIEGLGILIFDALEEPLKNAADVAIDTVGQISEAFANGDFEQIGVILSEAITQAMTYISANAETIFTIASNIMSSLVLGILENMPMVIDAATQVLSNFCNAFLADQEQLRTSITTLVGSLVNMIVECLPLIMEIGLTIVSAIAQGISDNLETIISGLTPVIARVLEVGAEIVTSLAAAISDNKDGLQNSIELIIDAFCDFIVVCLPMIIEAGVTILLALMDGITESLDKIMPAVVELVLAITEALSNNAPLMFTAATALIEGLIKGLIMAIPALAVAAVKLVVSLSGSLIDGAAGLITTGVKLISQLVLGIMQGIGSLISAGADIVKGICSGIAGAFGSVTKAAGDICNNVWKGITTTNWLELGGNIIEGVANGIRNAASSVLNAIGDMCGGALDWAKKLLKVNSPSKVFRDKVGVSIGEGVAVGIEKSTGMVSQATTDMCDTILADGQLFLEKQKALDKAWTDSKKEQYSAQKTALLDYIAEKKELNELSLEDEKHIYEALLKEAKGNAKELKEINELILEADEKAYQERYANSKQYISDKKHFNELTLDDELAAYERMKEYSKGHADELKEIEKEIYDVKQDIREREIDNVKDTNKQILDQLKDRLSKEKDLINANKNSELASLQAQLDGIDEAEEARQNAITRAGYETDITKIQEDLSNTDDVVRQQELNEQLFEKQQAFDEWKYKQELDDKKDAIREQMDAVREQAESQIDVKEETYDKEKALIEQQQAVMIQAIQSGQMEMVNQIRNGGAQSLNIQDANATLAMGINRSLTQDKENNLNQQYQAVIDNENKSVQAVEDAAVEMYRTNYRMGCQMANGIADGILNTSWRAVKAVSMMCDQMVNETKSKLDIHSPSRVFKRLGGYVSEGMGNGVTGEMSSVINSVKSMSRGMINAVDVSNLVGKLQGAVTGEMAINNARFSSGGSGNYTNTTTNNNSSMPITVNNYGTEKADKNFARDIGNEVSRKIRSRGYAL